MHVLTAEERLYVSGGSSEGDGNFLPGVSLEVRLGVEYILCGAGIAAEAPTLGADTVLTAAACAMAAATTDEYLAEQGITPEVVLDEVIVYGVNLAIDIVTIGMGIIDFAVDAFNFAMDFISGIGDLLSNIGNAISNCWDSISNSVSNWWHSLWGDDDC